MNVLMIILRVLHIFSGVFWAGTVFFFVTLLQPSVAAAGPEGGKVMGELNRRRFSVVLSALSGTTVLTGLILYWIDSDGLRNMTWMASGPGTALTLGGLFGLLALLMGVLVARPATAAMGKLMMQMQSAGKPPSPEQMGQVNALNARLVKSARWTAVFLALSLLGMASARYLFFG